MFPDDFFSDDFFADDFFSREASVPPVGSGGGAALLGVE